ncbi:hypothetical protein IAQ61_004070 [Plenodomus lingam]|nr:hypothetical protein IAQ61_004070 [Plenodomus lingam]
MGRLCGMGANIHRANNQSLVARRLMQGRQPATTRTITVGRRSTGLARGGEERRGQGLEEAKDRHGRTVSSREFCEKKMCQKTVSITPKIFRTGLVTKVWEPAYWEKAAKPGVVPRPLT